MRLGILALCLPVLAACDDAVIRSADGGTLEDATPGPIDAEPSDGGRVETDGGSPDGGPIPPAGAVLYPHDRRHSPIPADVAESLREIAARDVRADDVFAKVGDSITVSASFLQCFAGRAFDLDGRDALQATIDRFLAGDAAGIDPFRRASRAAGVGWTASRALAGDPSPLAQEITALSPRFAVVMYGTNDVGFVDVDTYTRNMAQITDILIAGGTIPILSSIPPRDDDAAADRNVPVFGDLVRALAASRAIPFVDYHRELLPIPDHGLAGDGVHPAASPRGACVLTPEGLTEGANVRNLLTLEALDRAARIAVDGEGSIDGDAPRLAGSGTQADPFVVPSLPFAAAGDTRTMGERAIDRYDGCAATQDESGAELRFRFALAAPTQVRAVVASGAGADIDVHLVRAGGDGSACVARGNREATAMLEAGEWEVIADTFTGTTELAGELFLSLRAE